jgi:hypothetical protein
MPYGSLTTQLRRESSTCNSMTAWQGGWSIADSTNRKSGPICEIRNEVPSTNNFIRTSAECPPRELSILMARDLIESARAFAARYDLRLCEPLGSGIHGSVHLVQDNLKGGATALKVHRSPEFYSREFAVYFRLRDAGISQCLDLPSRS